VTSTRKSAKSFAVWEIRKHPLTWRIVFALLKLDRQYYSTQDDGALREFFSKAVIAGKQIAKRPMLLLDAVKKWDLKALYVPDRKRILIDSSQHKLKWRWNEAHEVIHGVTEWLWSAKTPSDQLKVIEKLSA
jgi:hypothetical protein